MPTASFHARYFRFKTLAHLYAALVPARRLTGVRRVYNGPHTGKLMVLTFG